MTRTTPPDVSDSSSSTYGSADVPATSDTPLEVVRDEESFIADDEFPPTKATEYSSVSLFTFEDVDPLQEVMTPLEAQSQ